MAQRELIAARAKVEKSHADLLSVVAELKSRLSPASLAADAWNGVKQKTVAASDQGLKAVNDHRAPAGGAAVALVLFLLRHPLADLVTRLFGPKHPDAVKANMLDVRKDYDLTTSVVVPTKGTEQ